MTSDAKIGLLLGLVFIFIIAFLINGLPTFRSGKNNNELIVNSYNETSGIGKIPREVIRQTEQGMHAQKELSGEGQPSPKENERHYRYIGPLPSNGLVGKRTDESAPPIPSNPQIPAKANEVDKPTMPTLPKRYVVAAGDNLSIIAKRFYGPEEGNRIANINRIFQANRHLLKSEDEVYEGQEILIPALSGFRGNKPDSILNHPTLEPAEFIGKRHLPDDGTKAKQGGYYVVQEDDNLWRIAAKRLGDGSRYKEIARLNVDVLKDEDYLLVGTRLKMPAR